MRKTDKLNKKFGGISRTRILRLIWAQLMECRRSESRKHLLVRISSIRFKYLVILEPKTKTMLSVSEVKIFKCCANIIDLKT